MLEQNNELQVQQPAQSQVIQAAARIAGDIQMLSGGLIEQKSAMLLSSMFQSGFIKDVDSLSKAVTKVVFGQQIGIDVATALTSLYIIDGKPGLEARAIRNTLNLAGYDIKTEELTDTHCVLEWSYKGEKLGKSEYSVKDAMRAGYVDVTCTKYPEHNVRSVRFYNKWKKPQAGWDEKQDCECKDNWKRMPQEMLMARATTRGNNKFGNRVFKQEVYDIDELRDSPFTVDTEPTDNAIALIKGAKTLEEFNQIVLGLDRELVVQLQELINEKTRELINGAQ